ncbi:MAG: bifunctional aldolase/short-chain dehydrogenase [Alphaproteobacteria bacterium]|jgi:rhamnose utilization protein RhaD (predicted bifunctional aldolase and dehydrogenase)/NAD(P)-dependent dehydrogenase (short-subunit alcohol dehydrogenase family)|nr:bifunctional aldolase/short-chain dehydrogenase [Alphaproteobacteria bacterium]
MKNLWSDREARSYVRRYGRQGFGRDLALRVYTSRLLGGEPKLVLHGGGNTSVKTTVEDVAGEPVEAICVKGSGWDMAEIEPPGLPALRLEPLRRLADLKSMSDEEMVNQHRANLLDATAPTPSVETLLHAFLPAKFVDHTHANAVLALTNQPNGAKICRHVFGDRVALVPYMLSGLELSKKVMRAQRTHPEAEGVVLMNHGLVTFGESAEEAYRRTIQIVTLAERRLAERRLARGRRKSHVQAKLPVRLARPTEIAPILRGQVAADGGDGTKRFVLAYRSNRRIREHVSARDVKRLARAGNATPDHAIRVKGWPLVVPAPVAGDLDAFARGASRAVADFRKRYRAYVARQSAKVTGPIVSLDDSPRVILVPGLGLFGVGDDARAANIAADLAEATIDVVRGAEAVGRFRGIGEADQFAVEYWSLEQAKLGTGGGRPLQGQVAVVTGAAGTIGGAIAAVFRAAGAEVALLDRDASDESQGLVIRCDVTDGASVRRAYRLILEAYGGIDILISNAGAAWQGAIGEVSEAVMRKSFELNFFAHQRMAQHAVRIMQRQGTGGVLLFNASKQAVDPGPELGPYGVAKAATLTLARQYALEYGAHGIRANAVNADRIRGGLLTDAMVRRRAKARNVDEDTYMRGNLLGREVRAEDVARAFLDLALAEKTTGAVITVDGGNIAAALR